MSVATPERERVLELIRAHGWNSTSFQTLERGYAYYFHGSGCVAYVETRGARIVAGAPIAATAELHAIADAFVRETEAVGKRCCFVATEERFREITRDSLRSVQIGEQPVWDPRSWPQQLAARKSLREQLRRARAKGVRVRALTPTEMQGGAAHDAIRRIAQRWLASREMAPMDFLLRVEPLTYPDERRCFVAEKDGVIVGFAAAIPVPARAGWFIEDLVREPDAPNGTAESLVDAVMRWAAAAGCEWLTLGLAPLAGDVRGFLRVARRTTTMFYDFTGLQAFKTKLGPNGWMPIHLSYPPSQGALVSVLDVLVAFAGGGPLRFAMRSLLRGPAAVIRMFALLLVPWTLLLALAPAEPWFGATWAKWAWVGFDIALAIGLFRALRRPTVASLELLAIAASADAVLTLVHAVVVHGGRPGGVLPTIVVVVACVAPLLAAIVLWGAARRFSRESRG